VIERGETWCLSTKGTNSTDEARIRRLLQPLGVRVWPFDRSNKLRSGVRFLRDVARHRPALVILEGTGFGGGIPLMVARILGRTRYLVSSGDAIAPILALRSRLVYPVALAYEVLLYRLSSGFIGWTPYLAGRALTFGAPRAITAENWSLAADQPGDRSAARERLGIPHGATVFGIVGSLVWTPRRDYCYGKELVAALRHCTRSDVRVLIVGDGTGYAELQKMLTEHPDHRVILTGAVPLEKVPLMLSAMDVASLPQSMDAVGMFRYTTKLSEYVAAGLPVVTGQLPFAYDLDEGWLWRLPGSAPWDDRYARAFGELMDEVTRSDIVERASHAAAGARRFDGPAQQRRVTAFVTDILADARRTPQPL
jgi:hypothetical protein